MLMKVRDTQRLARLPDQRNAISEPARRSNTRPGLHGKQIHRIDAGGAGQVAARHDPGTPWPGHFRHSRTSTMSRAGAAGVCASKRAFELVELRYGTRVLSRYDGGWATGAGDAIAHWDGHPLSMATDGGSTSGFRFSSVARARSRRSISGTYSAVGRASTIGLSALLRWRGPLRLSRRRCRAHRRVAFDAVRPERRACIHRRPRRRQHLPTQRRRTDLPLRHLRLAPVADQHPDGAVCPVHRVALVLACRGRHAGRAVPVIRQLRRSDRDD